MGGAEGKMSEHGHAIAAVTCADGLELISFLLKNIFHRIVKGLQNAGANNRNVCPCERRQATIVYIVSEQLQSNKLVIVKSSYAHLRAKHPPRLNYMFDSMGVRTRCKITAFDKAT